MVSKIHILNNKKNKISVSIVLYNTSEVLLHRLLTCIYCSGNIDIVYIVDNSPQPIKDFWFKDLPLSYIHTNSNIGYGAGHNIAIRKAIEMGAEFHFVLNPDVYFGSGELPKMISRIQSDNAIGHLMPKVTYADGTLQYLCKLLPTPSDLLLRRFAFGPLKRLFMKKVDKFELRFTGYNREMNVPFLSGCFMLLRVSALQEIGLFDESFFMYGEDIDLSRRMHARQKTVFFPDAVIVHDHARESYKNTKMLWIHIVNLIRYFNKWGWFFDAERYVINAKVLRDLDS